MILALAKNWREESLWLLRIAMMTIESWFVFSIMENIDGNWWKVSKAIAMTTIKILSWDDSCGNFLNKLWGHSYGNYFDPAKDCSSVVDNVPKATSGIYWIQTKNGPIKVSTRFANPSTWLVLRRNLTSTWNWSYNYIEEVVGIDSLTQFSSVY